jgi:hypothetical protein
MPSIYYNLPYPFGKITDNVGFEDASLSLKTKDSVGKNIGGNFVINEISITTRQGLNVSLLDAFETISINEHMFSSAVIGSITIIDVGAGIEKFQLQGGEKITLKLSKPTTNEILLWREDFIINKIGAHMVDVTNLTSKYTLYFTSRSFVNSTKKNLFKSYKGSVANTVFSIFSEMSKNDLMLDDPKITLQKPFISTGLMPHRAIEEFAQRSCSKSKFFLFFERLFPVVGTYANGKAFAATHYFGSYDKLIEDSDLSGGGHNIYFMPNQDGQMESNLIRTSRLTKKDNFNHIELLTRGHYSSTITSLDPIKRNSTTTNVGYTDNATQDLYSTKLLDSNNIFSTYSTTNGETPGRRLIFNSEYFNDPIQRESWLRSNIFGSLSKIMFKLDIDIQGATNSIGTGHVINLVVPSGLDKKILPSSSTPILDQYHGGKYFVSGVQHNITLSSYIKKLELTRGSIPIDLNKNGLTQKDLSEQRYD